MGSSDDDMLDDVFDEMEKQNEYVFNDWDAGDQFMQWIREEQAYVTSAWGGRVPVMSEDGMNVEYGIPDECAVAHTNYFVMTEASDNKERVYDLLNWLYEPENTVELSTTTTIRWPWRIRRTSSPRCSNTSWAPTNYSGSTGTR